MRVPRGGLSLLLVTALGGIAALGQQPYDLPIFLLLALAGALWLFDPGRGAARAALFGWLFGLGYFLHAMHWILSPFMVDPDRHGWMAPFALLFLAAGLALFWGLAFWAARFMTPGARWPIIFTFPAVELLRAYLFSGLPWAMPSQALVGVPPGQLLAWIGPYALNLLIVTVALLGAAALNRSNGMLLRTLAFGLFAAGCLSLYAPRPLSPAELTGQTVRLVQPNAPQREKWDPERIPVFFERQLEFSAAPPQGEAPPDLILWSETAIPWLLERADPALERISEASNGTPVALGVQRQEAGDYYNSLVLLDGAGKPGLTYDKHHLVPFGEFIPFTETISRIGLRGLADRFGGGYSAGAGPQLLDFGAVGKALPLICYEAVFPRNLRGTEERPDFILQLTNDAWFGNGAGPLQHLAQARMRAIEQGLPLARAANTGISAMIDPRGTLLAQIPLNEAGFVDAPLPRPLPPTPYARIGDFPFFLLLLFGLCICAIAGRRV